MSIGNFGISIYTHTHTNGSIECLSCVFFVVHKEKKFWNKKNENSGTCPPHSHTKTHTHTMFHMLLFYTCGVAGAGAGVFHIFFSYKFFPLFRL